MTHALVLEPMPSQPNYSSLEDTLKDTVLSAPSGMPMKHTAPLMVNLLLKPIALQNTHGATLMSLAHLPSQLLSSLIPNMQIPSPGPMPHPEPKKKPPPKCTLLPLLSSPLPPSPCEILKYDIYIQDQIVFIA